ncbi:MAG: Rne/Rng family ribonuclease [Endomicrobiia bacterium]|nr:Rne/Rng family ribonuclease [Endomicrobiaceae bacterium]MDD3053735.1 Rne/Rng family ribonuclease [Endomicrobiaceae bacterium]MDD3922651.1 Rne/Rng family ribonuclease [Endomicrobiaceae bacterium]MDD5101543.1 Rne/Rng family ribonuclease [Endomicrobiaceae bacterium]
MSKEIIVNRTHEETRVAVLDNSKLSDIFIERRESEKILNNIYKGKVQNIVAGLSSAFVDIGFGKSAYLSMDDIVASKNEHNIENMLKVGQEIMVQIYKEPISTKGPKVTMDISLPGRLLVYMPFSNNIGVSKQIEDKEEYTRLKNIVKKLKTELAGGIIVRTEAEDATEEEIEKEIKYLSRLWGSIINRFTNSKIGSVVHKDLGVVFQTVRDHFTEDVSLMYIDSPKELKDVVEFVKTVSPELEDRILLYDGKQPIFKAYGIEEEIKRLRSNKARLESGGYLIIQEAESLCAVDVNSGKFTGNNNTQEEVVTMTNIEAATEIARQLRLRNIGGIIVIDFIDMKKEKNRKKVLEQLRAAVKGDKAKIKIWPITRLGLIEMTRERKRESLFSLLGDTCPTCHGLGLVLSKESIFINVCQEIEQIGIEKHYGKIKVKLCPEVAKYFAERKERLNELFKKDIEIIPTDSVDREDYNIILEQ